MQLPYPLVFIDINGPIRSSDFKMATAHSRRGVTLCIRTETGPDSRGGYFFHVKEITGGYFEICDIEKDFKDELTEEDLIQLINHVTGREFSERAFKYSIQQINLRHD